METKIYVGHALTHAPEHFLTDMVALKKELRDVGFTVLDFAWKDGKQLLGVSDVYEYDLKQVEKSDLFVAICTLPSIGLGMELERAFQLKKPTLVFTQRTVHLTSIVPHGLNYHGLQAPLGYDGIYEIVDAVKSQRRR